MIERDELAAWLRLVDTPSIGRQTARRLLAAFGSPQAIFDAPAGAHRELLTPAQTEALSATPPSLDARKREIGTGTARADNP